ncbi:MAG: DUF5615 family PIN-like protein [Candidatus Hodarchaeota archaeon]
MDENTPNILKKVLKEKGNHDIVSVRDEALGGSSDHILAKVCKEEERVLITLDMDFSKLPLHEISSLYGVIILSPASLDRWEIKELMEYFIENFNIEDTIGKVFIVEEDRVRIREERLNLKEHKSEEK